MIVRADITWRCAGLGALAVAALSSVAHRSVLAAHHAGPASAWEALFGLVTFVAAALGILLLIHGRQLFRSRSSAAHREPSPGAEIIDMPVRDRHAIVTLLAARELARARGHARRH